MEMVGNQSLVHFILILITVLFVYYTLHKEVKFRSHKNTILSEAKYLAHQGYAAGYAHQNYTDMPSTFYYYTLHQNYSDDLIFQGISTSLSSHLTSLV